MCLKRTDILSLYPNKIAFPYETGQHRLPGFFFEGFFTISPSGKIRKENKPMEYKKIPLDEQLEKAGRKRIHPEHDACAVQAFGKMPLCDYMKNGHYAARLGMALGIPPEQLEKMTVRETALLISRQKRPGPGVLPHRQLLLLFAAPMSEAYRAWKEALDKKDGKKEGT